MDVERVADILWVFLQRKHCPKCEGKLKLEVRRKKGNHFTKLITEVWCSSCGVKVVSDKYEPVEVLEDKLMLRQNAADIVKDLEESVENWYRDIAERLRSSA